MTDNRGCPVSVSVFDGNTADPKTLLPQVEKIKNSFGIDRLALVGDRGMITNVQIEAIKAYDGFDWITALKSGSIADLVHDKTLQPELFDERNLLSLTHPDYPGEQLVACRNPELAKRRAAKRKELIAATVIELEKIKAAVEVGRLKGEANIGERYGRIVGKYKVAKHFKRTIKAKSLSGIFAIEFNLQPAAQFGAT
jgi:transposase